MTDPMKPLTERTTDELGAYVDDHIVMALHAADLLSTTRQDAEDYVRNRLVAISDTYATSGELSAERVNRSNERLRRVLEESQ